MKKVLVFGTFDLFHPGHKFFLQQAKKQGDFLTVVIARDNNVKKNKGRFPKQNEKIRLQNIKKLKFVNQAILGYQDWRKRYKIIKKINPYIICLGYDQKTRKIKNIKTIHLKAFKPHIYKTSLLC